VVRKLLFCTLLFLAGFGFAQSDLYWAIANNDALAAWKLTQPGELVPMPAVEDLSWAVSRGSGEVFDVLSYRGAPVAGIDESGRNLLFEASLAGRLDLFRKIALSGARLDQVDLSGLSLVHAAAQSVQTVMVPFLLRNGLPPAARSELGVTPLMLASQEGRLENVKTLLNWGANPADQDYLGRSVLWYANRGKNPQTLALLNGELGPAESEPSGEAPLP
jgi:ankyrin repeat protein